jgi:hypothetical protein
VDIGSIIIEAIWVTIFFVALAAPLVFDTPKIARAFVMYKPHWFAMAFAFLVLYMVLAPVQQKTAVTIAVIATALILGFWYKVRGDLAETHVPFKAHEPAPKPLPAPVPAPAPKVEASPLEDFEYREGSPYLFRKKTS